jgi:hypothetical protein
LFKVKFKGEVKPRNKVFRLETTNYSQIVAKIIQGLSLSGELYYRLYYLDAEKDEIDIGN